MAERNDHNAGRREADGSEPWYPIVMVFLLMLSAAALAWMLVFRH